jgi:DNA modification methylase
MQNKLFYGDNLEVLRKYVSDESIDLCYIDPPFNSKRTYNQIYKNTGKEDTAQAQAFLDTWTWNRQAQESFEDIIGNSQKLCTKQSIELVIGLEKILGKGALLAYLVSMTQRIAEIYRVLKPTGSFYLHCDPTASHYLKLVLDSIFCSQGGDFKNEIVWRRTYDVGAFKVRKNSFANMQDVIFLYTKSNISTFNQPFTPYEKDYQKRFNLDDNDGQGRYYWADLNRPSQGSIQRLEAAGELKQRTSGRYSYKRYFNRIKNEGVPIGNIWIDINRISSREKEALGYPTQKPEPLLERIIQASSNEGDVILDCYCGCGTTIAVAERLNRKWIGIDITYQSISVILKRLNDSFGGDYTQDLIDKETKKLIRPARLQLSGVPQDFSSAVALANKQDDRLRKEFEKWAVLTFTDNQAMINDKKGGDSGIDGTAIMVDFDENNKQVYKTIIFSVKTSKTLSPSVIRDLFGTIEREKAAVGYLLTLHPMPNLVKEAAKYGSYESKSFKRSLPKIEVISIAEMLDGSRLGLPTVDVLKSAERKKKQDLIPDIFDEENE